MFGDAFGGKGAPRPAAPMDILITLDCTLHEFYNGCMKQVTYERQVLQHDGKTTAPRREEM